MRQFRSPARLFAAVVVFVMTFATEAVAGVRGYTVTVHPEGFAPLRLYVEDVGSGPPVVLLHGLGGSGYAWRRIVPALAKTNRVITIDMMGFGRSEKPMHDRYASTDHARVVKAALVALRLRDVTLVGHSLGGLVALLVAIETRHSDPGRVSRLATFNAPALPQEPSEGVAFLQQPLIPYVALSIIPPETMARIGLLTGAKRMNHITEKDIAVYADPLREAGGTHAIIQTARQIAPDNPRAIIRAYPTLHQPTLVAGCAEDHTVPITTARRLSRMLPHARLAVMRGCDHMPMEQNPGAVIKTLKDFLAS